MAQSIVCIYKFKLLAGVDESQFLEVSNKIQQFFATKKGFAYRSVSKSEDDLWTDINYWNSKELLEKLDAEFNQQDDCKKFMSMIDESTILREQSMVKLSASIAA